VGRFSPRRLGRRLHEFTPPWSWIASLAVLLVLVGLAMGQLGELLGAMHASGRPGFTVSALNHVFHPFADVEQTKEVLRVWRGYADATLEAGLAPGTADARDVVHLFVRIDSFLFVPLYLGLLVLFFLRCRREFAADSPTPGHFAAQLERRGLDAERTAHGYRTAALIGILAISVTAVADWVENICYSRLVYYAWEGFPVQPANYESHRFSIVAHILWFATLVKWVAAVAAVLLALGLGWVVLARVLSDRRRQRAMRRRWRRFPSWLFAPMLLVVAFGLVLLVPDQLPDLVRRWVTYQLLLCVALIGLFAFTVWAVTRRLLLRGTWHVSRTASQEAQLKAFLFAGLVALALAQLVVGVFLRRSRYDLGWGLVIPAALLGGVALLGLVLPDPTQDEPAPDTDETTEEQPELPPEPRPEPVVPRLLAASVLVLFGFGLIRASFGFAVYTQHWTIRPVLVLVAAGLGAGASYLIGRRLADVAPRAFAEPLVGAIVGATVVTLAIAVADGDAKDVDPSLVAVWAVLATVAGLRVFALLRRERPLQQQLQGWIVVVLGALLAVVCALCVAVPWWTGEILSGIGVIAAFLVAVTVVGGFITWVTTGIPVPRGLRALGFGRFPLVPLLIVWFFLASFFDHDGAYHNARVRTADAAATPVTLEQAFDCWLSKNNLPRLGGAQGSCAATPRGAARTGAVPLVFVSSTGGGIRSAFWTALALDCTFERDTDTVDDRNPCPARRATDYRRSDSLFAASGISGGSVGLAEYAAYLKDKTDGRDVSGWVADRLGVDGLSPAGAWWLFVEIPRVFIQFDSPTDRAAVLEKAWERRWPSHALEAGLFQLWRTYRHTPLLLLNGTNVGDGCRFNVSVLDGNIELRDPREQYNCRSNAPFDEDQALTAPPAAGAEDRLADKSVLPATRDLSDFLCNQPADISLSTAALLSARFPYVNPSGRLVNRCPEQADRPAVAHVVDGGYLDTSGASPVVEIMARLDGLISRWRPGAPADTCVVPFMIQIDNGFEDASPPRSGRRPAELTVPPKTVFDARIGRAAEARSAAAVLFDQPRAGVVLAGRPLVDRYAHFVNQAHPGPAAPFGWTQSRFAEDELSDQLRQKKNLQALAEVRQWFAAAKSGRLSCTG
jgi:hypothetical protein